MAWSYGFRETSETDTQRHRVINKFIKLKLKTGPLEIS